MLEHVFQTDPRASMAWGNRDGLVRVASRADSGCCETHIDGLRDTRSSEFWLCESLTRSCLRVGSTRMFGSSRAKQAIRVNVVC